MTVFIKCPGLAQQLRTNLQPTACQLRAGSELTSNSETAPKEHNIQYINRFTLFIPYARAREKRRKEKKISPPYPLLVGGGEGGETAQLIRRNMGAEQS